MPTTIKLKNSVTTTNAPSSLVQGEVAINITDKKVWVGNAATTPIQLLGDGGSASFTSIAFGAGTVSSPSITFTGDTNTGIYSPAADTIGFTEGGVEGLRINSNGQTSTSIAGTASLPSFTRTGDENTGIFFPAADTIAFTEGGVESMRIDSSGNVGIGTSSPATRLHVAGDSVTELRITSSGSLASTAAALVRFGGSNSATSGYVGFGGTANDFYNWNALSGASIFGTANTERMRITSGGVVCVNTTNTYTNARLVVAGSSTPGDIVMARISAGVVQPTTYGTGDLARFSFYEGDSSVGFRRFLDIVSDGSAGTAGSNIRFYTNNSAAAPVERMRIDDSGRVGINTTTFSTGYLTIDTKAQTGIDIYRSDSTAQYSGIRFRNTTNGSTYGSLGWDSSGLRLDGDAGIMYFSTSGTERMRINSDGNVLVGTTVYNDNTKGILLSANGRLYAIAISAPPLTINRLTSDGDLVEFKQADALEGTISVSGTTVSYNGGHLARWSQLPNNQKDDTLLKGTVMSNLDDMCVWVKDGETLPNEQLNKMKVSDVEGDTNVAGVFVNWTRDEDCNTDDMNVAMTGDMIIRIAEGVVVQKGDLLMSAGDGTAKPQGDDIVRSKTIAKVTSNHITCTYQDGSYCVPCVLMAC